MNCTFCGNELVCPPWGGIPALYCLACHKYFHLDSTYWPQEIEHIVLDHEEEWDTPSFTVDADGHELPQSKIAELEESYMRRKGL